MTEVGARKTSLRAKPGNSSAIDTRQSSANSDPAICPNEKDELMARPQVTHGHRSSMNGQEDSRHQESSQERAVSWSASGSG
eukprot:939549-Prorocentrum_minimum.AAC.5